MEEIVELVISATGDHPACRETAEGVAQLVIPLAVTCKIVERSKQGHEIVARGEDQALPPSLAGPVAPAVASAHAA